MTRFIEAIIIKDDREVERIPVDERMIHKFAGKAPSSLLTTEGRRIEYDDIQVEDSGETQKKQN